MKTKYNLTDEDILNILLNAYDSIYSGSKIYLCDAIGTAIVNYLSIEFIPILYSNIPEIIPEFTSEFLTGVKRDINSIWWNKKDIQSRKEALDRLISIYECRIYKKNYKITNELILKTLIKAKKICEDRISSYMCTCITKSFPYAIHSHLTISFIIPEFNRDFLNAKYKEGGCWWDNNDEESRLKAFDKLIKVYERNIK